MAIVWQTECSCHPFPLSLWSSAALSACVSEKKHAFDSWFGPKCCFLSCSVGILLKKVNLVCMCVFYLHRNLWCWPLFCVALFCVFLLWKTMNSALSQCYHGVKEATKRFEWHFYGPIRRLLHYLVSVSSWWPFVARMALPVIL